MRLAALISTRYRAGAQHTRGLRKRRRQNGISLTLLTLLKACIRNQRPPKIPPAGNVEIAHPPKNPIFYRNVVLAKTRRTGSARSVNKDKTHFSRESETVTRLTLARPRDGNC